jgi:O-glycosyl hydrolase
MKKFSFLTVLVCALAVSTFVFTTCGDIAGATAPPRKTMQPYISEQPASFSYTIDSWSTAPALTAKIDEWNTEDGQLSYQWFQFTSIDDYFKNQGGTAIGEEIEIDYENDSVFVPIDDPLNNTIGNITLTCTPGNITNPTADARYFYYVYVTNRDEKAGDTKIATMQSEVAAISFSAAGEPLYPIIITNPASAAYVWGTPMNDLRVRAKLATGSPVTDTLSYKWRKKKLNAAGDAYEIVDITGDINKERLVVDYQNHGLGLNENIFFVEVTNTDDSAQTKTAASIPAILNIKPGRAAAAPVVTLHPKDGLYFTTEVGSIAPLTVAGVSTDAGVITYQWYKNTANSNKGGTVIAGATNATYSVTATAQAGSAYYYAEVINTNNNVTQAKTASAASAPAKITVGTAATADTASVYLTIADTSKAENRFNYMRGYGGMDVAWGNFPRTTRADTELMYDPDRLGYNMLRIMIRADHTDPSETIAELLAGDRPDYYENVKIVNKYNGYVLASPWTPPKEWKSNNSINGGGILIPNYYGLFAEYLRKFAQNMADNGAPIYAISISNEPNYVAGYDGCEWEPEQMMAFYVTQGHFTTRPSPIRGWGGGKEQPHVLTMNGESANTPQINVEALNNPTSKEAIDVLARHIYGERTVSLWNEYPAQLYRDKGGVNDNKIEVWMTEHNINSANATGYYNDSKWNYVWRFLNDVDLSLRMNNENAFVWWASKRFYSMVGDGQFGTSDGAPLPRGWALAHYARFSTGMTRVNIGLTAGKESYTSTNTRISDQGNMHATRPTERVYNVLNNKGDDMDNLAARVTAYISDDGKEISLVMWTPTKTNGSGGYGLGTVRIELPTREGANIGETETFTVKGVTAVRSFGDRPNQLFQPYDVKLNTARTVVFVDVPVKNIVSIKLTGDWL